MRRRGSRRVNQRGTRLSHPVAIGKRVSPVKIRLALATARAMSSAIPNCAAKPAAPTVPNARRKVCGIGPITLMGCPSTKVSTVLVPRMNITAITGAEIIDRLPDGARRAAAFAGQNRHILETAERAHRHLPEDRQAEPVRFGQLPGKRLEARNGAAHQRPYRQPQQNHVGQQDHHAARVVQPLADIESAHRDGRDSGHHRAGQDEGRPAAGRQPRPPRAEHVSQVRGHHEDDRAHTTTA